MRRGEDRTLPRGGALVVLGAIVGMWVLARVALWESPFAPAALALPDASAPIVRAPAPDTGPVDMPGAVSGGPAAAEPPAALPAWRKPVPPPRIERPLPTRPVAWSGGAGPLRSRLRRGFAGARHLAGHAMLLQAGREWNDTFGALAGPQLADAGTGSVQGRPPIWAPQTAQELRGVPAPNRWSGDAWALWREGGAAPPVAGQPSYGRSQAGAVLHYRLAPGSPHAPQLHLRASAALNGVREAEIALGASARPLPRIPIRLAAEARVSERSGGRELRGAAYGVTELPRVQLPAGFAADIYAQGGYVTGDFATAFVDGQARVTRPVGRVEDFRLEAGAGAWGGAQEGASRLDVGPTASLGVRLGAVNARLSADYRFRVAGDAEPASGPALTLSAGF